MLEKCEKLRNELHNLENRFLKSVEDNSLDQGELWEKCREKRKELIIEEIEKHNYQISEDLRLIAEDFKEKYPSIASDALELVDAYSAKTKGEK